jgi:hypothetical protein
MIDLTEARAIAAAYINEGVKRPTGFTPVIIDTATLDSDSCWVFYYDALEYQRSRDVADALAGNLPVVVLKKDGRVELASATESIDDWLAARFGR